MMLTVAMCVPIGIFLTWVLVAEFRDWRQKHAHGTRARLATEPVVMSAESILYAAWLEASGP
jgi:hypothetical protein